MRTSDFDYELPGDLIAQHPAPERDLSRLLVIHRVSGAIDHRPSFRSFLDYLSADDALVLNDSRVIPARVRGERHNSTTSPEHGMAATQSPAQFEILLLEEVAANEWWAMLRPGKRARKGTVIRLHGVPSERQILATVQDTNAEGHRLLRFSGSPDILHELEEVGEVPLPPYICRQAGRSASADRERYQTVFAERAGSVAAPTAGLHFTPEMLQTIQCLGVQVIRVTLHVGLGTFAPVKQEQLAEHPMHEERYEISSDAAERIERTRSRGGRVFAVGTTSLRVLESAAVRSGGVIRAGSGRTRLFVYPPYRFQVVNALLTNFHLPRSTLLMLVSAFAAPESTSGVGLVRQAYEQAIRARYRFFSYGDAMLIL